jgi:hypothetical protein
MAMGQTVFPMRDWKLGNFLLTRWRLVIGEGEVLVSRAESREDEGVDEGLWVV